MEEINTELICPICGSLFHRKASYLKKMKDPSRATCSIECGYKMRKQWSTGENNHQFGKKGYLNASWKSDYRNKIYGFKRVLDHPFKDSQDLVPIYRLVADKYLCNEYNSIIIDGKRYIKKECVIHHINFDKKDDSPQNLYVFLNKSMHILFHNLYGYRINSIEEFEVYYNDKYTNKILNYNWLYTAYVIFDLSINQISSAFDIPYKSVENQITSLNFKEIKQNYNSNFIINVLELLSNNESIYDEIIALGSSGK